MMWQLPIDKVNSRDVKYFEINEIIRQKHPFFHYSTSRITVQLMEAMKKNRPSPLSSLTWVEINAMIQGTWWEVKTPKINFFDYPTFNFTV